MDACIDVAKQMAQVSEILKVPLVVGEQYPKVFGKTVPELQAVLPKDTMVFSKRTFSLITPEVKTLLKKQSAI